LNRANVRILVLDDEPFTLKLHTHMLGEMGFSSAVAFENGLAALKSFDAGTPPDVILLDLSMPGMDGIEFIRHLVVREFRGALVLISGEDERLLQSAAKLVQAHGIDVLGHLSKPVKPMKLQSLLGSWERRADDEPRRPGKTYGPDEVRRAIRNGELISYFQPKVSVMTGEFIGVEALARWQHPQDGLVSPAGFVGVAEEHGMAEDLTREIAVKGIKAVSALAGDGMSLQVALNLSPSALRSIDLADFLAKEAARHSMAPQNVMLEITESQLIADRRAPLDVLTRLRLMRFRLSIDDFGTGYSSLAQLKDMPFDELKIDRGFVHRAAADRTSRAMYEASLGIAKQLQMKTVAEGVEDRADWDFVRSTECETAQGYFIGRPMPADALRGWAETWRDRMVSGVV